MKRKTNLGFTLIELMIVVAIIGVLAVLAIFGVSVYLKRAKTAEATNSLGSINQDAVQAYTKEHLTASIAVGLSLGTNQTLCPSSTGSIPAAVPANQKSGRRRANRAVGTSKVSTSTRSDSPFRASVRDISISRPTRARNSSSP